LRENGKLVSKIRELVGESKYQEIVEIIDSLLEIERFQIDFQTTGSLHLKFQKISKLLYEKFQVKNFKITQVINGIETVRHLQINDHEKTFDTNVQIALNENGLIKIDFYNDHLDELGQLQLDSYLEEILTTLYLSIIVDALQESALLDPLTGLKNRLAFNEEMKDIVPLAIREHMNIGVLLFNIDRFRAVNDEHGTQFGDKFLKHYAKIIQDNIRSSDIAIRFGGGEFLVLLINVVDEEKTYSIAKELQTKLNESHILSPNFDDFYKTVSVGISMFPQDSSDIFEVVHNANSALSDARDTGRSKIVRYEHDEGELDLF